MDDKLAALRAAIEAERVASSASVGVRVLQHVYGNRLDEVDEADRREGEASAATDAALAPLTMPVVVREAVAA